MTLLLSLRAFARPSAIEQYGLSPREVLSEGRWVQVLSSGFLHGSIGHLFFNMLTLYFFGPSLERVLGGPKFAVVYFGSLVAGSLFTILRHRNEPRYRAIGASGAVSGVLFGFVLFAPFADLMLILLPIPIPAVIFALLYVVVSIWGMERRIGNIGHAAHLGGAIGGVVLTILMEPRVVPHFFSQIFP